MPFLPLSQALPFAQSVTLNSGRIPGLPTRLTGMHKVSLRILQRKYGFTMPVIRYFVSMDAGLPPLRGMD